MKKNPFSRGSYSLPVFVIASVIVLITFLYSCGSNPKKEPQAFGGEIPKGASSSISCLKLTKAQIQTWVDSGWTNPNSEGAINEILFQFYSPDVALSSSNLDLIAMPGSSISTVKKTGKLTLGIDSTCTSLSVSGGAILSNIQAMISSVDIFNNDGTLKNFDYLRLTPVRYSKDNDYISFNMQVISNGAPTGGAAVQLAPCPPWCCPPMCSN